MVTTEDQDLLIGVAELHAESTDDVVCFCRLNLDDSIREVSLQLSTDLVETRKDGLPIELRRSLRLLTICLVVGKQLAAPVVFRVGSDDQLTVLWAVLGLIGPDAVENHVSDEVFI